MKENRLYCGKPDFLCIFCVGFESLVAKVILVVSQKHLTFNKWHGNMYIINSLGM